MILVTMACAIRNDDMTGWLMAWARLMAQNVWSFQPLLLFLCICAPLQLVGCSVSHIALYILCDFVHSRLYSCTLYTLTTDCTLHLITEGCDSRKASLMRCQYFEKKMEHTTLFLVLQNGKCMELSGGTFPVLTCRIERLLTNIRLHSVARNVHCLASSWSVPTLPSFANGAVSVGPSCEASFWCWRLRHHHHLTIIIIIIIVIIIITSAESSTGLGNVCDLQHSRGILFAKHRSHSDRSGVDATDDESLERCQCIAKPQPMYIRPYFNPCAQNPRILNPRISNISS